MDGSPLDNSLETAEQFFLLVDVPAHTLLSTFFSLLSHGASPTFCCGFTQASYGGAEPSERRPSVAALAALGRRMGVPEVAFISGFSHYLFPNLSRLRGAVPLLFIQLCNFILHRDMRT